MTWKEVCREIAWPFSDKLLAQDSMSRLVRLRRQDPEGILPDADGLLATWLRKERKETP